MLRAIRNTIIGFWSLLVGLRVTIINFFRHSVTLQYPLEKWKTPERFRGLLNVYDFFDESSINKKSQYFKEGQIPPCEYTCPANTDVRGYITAIAEGDYKRGIRILKDIYPLAGVLGRVCPAPCQQECNRYVVHNSPLAIRYLKRFLADYNLNLSPAEKVPLSETKPVLIGKKVAVIGSGPAGLTCAADLAKLGYKVTIFEALSTPGGYLAIGIPEYRLPRNILEGEIKDILDLGVDLKLNTSVGKDITIEDLVSEGYEAVFLGTGATKPVKLNVVGEDLKGVIGGEDFLREVNLKKSFEVGDRVIIIGGGNTAIDSARTSVRLGAKEVFIFYRRTLAEMPADIHEVKQAQEEGVKIEFLVGPTKVLGEDGKVSGLEFCRMELGEPDSSGRRRPVPIPGCGFIQPCQTIITAISREADLSWLTSEVKLTKWKTIQTDDKGHTTSGWIFAAGDVVLGPATVIEAIAGGKKAAVGIDEYLKVKN